MPRGVATPRLPRPVAEPRARRGRSRGSAACGPREKKKFARGRPRRGTGRKEPAGTPRPAVGRSRAPGRTRRGSARRDEVFAISASVTRRPPRGPGEPVGDAAPGGTAERRREARIIRPEISTSSTETRLRFRGPVVGFFSGPTAASRGAATRDPVALPPPREADPGSPAFLPSGGPRRGELRTRRLRRVGKPAPLPEIPSPRRAVSRRSPGVPLAAGGPPRETDPGLRAFPRLRGPDDGGLRNRLRSGDPCGRPRNYLAVLGPLPSGRPVHSRRPRSALPE